MLRAFSILPLLSTLLLTPAFGGNVLRTVAELREAVYDTVPRDERFELEATVTHGTDELGGDFAITDGKDAISVSDAVNWPTTLLSAGERLHLAGTISVNALGYNTASATQVVRLASGPVPRPMEMNIADLKDPACSDRLVRFSGTVFDVFRDETDIRFIFLIVTDDAGESVYVPVYAADVPFETFARNIDARIAVTALTIRDRKGSTKRKMESNVSHVTRADLEVLTPPPADPFDVPLLAGSIRDVTSPRPGQSRRRRVCGEVVAVWHGNRLLIRRDDDEFSKVMLLDGDSLPKAGEIVEAVGVPDTDLYHLNLSRARWRTATGGQANGETPQTVSARDLLTDGAGHRQIGTKLHGHVVRLRGRVIEPSDESIEHGILTLESDGFHIQVDASATPVALNEVETGAEIEVTGTCVVEIENWRPQVPFPSVVDCVIVVRSPTDVIVLARPPWWTVGRLLAVIGSLLVLLAGFGVWNRTLNRLVERRGRELLREQIGRAKAALKAEERTRLAVELHDSLAQSLTGAAMEVETAAALRDAEPGEMVRHLDLAGKTLKSCRDDLRNSLWDLRSRALEEPTIEAAIRRTMSPHLNLARLAIRFNVPRNRLSDSLMHMLLRVVRELTLNAIRHGKATTVQIAGNLDGDLLLFSVSDNGCGFDPDDCPGILQGHFGLEGVRERLDQAGGELTINSAIGRGTKIRATIPLHSQEF